MKVKIEYTATIRSVEVKTAEVELTEEQTDHLAWLMEIGAGDRMELGDDEDTVMYNQLIKQVSEELGADPLLIDIGYEGMEWTDKDGKAWELEYGERAMAN